MFYYAYLNSENIVVGVYALPTKITENNYIEITKEEYEDERIIGSHYDPESHTFNMWACSTDNVQIVGTDTSLTTKLNEMQEDISANTDDITTANSDISSMQSSVNALNNAIAIVSGDLTATKEKVSTIEQSASEIATELSGVQETVSNISETVDTQGTDIGTIKADITAIEENVTENTASIETNAQNITSASNEIATAKADIATVKNDLDSANFDIGDLREELLETNTNVSENFDGITAAENEIAAVKNSVSSLSANVSSVTGRVAKNETDIKAIQTDLSGTKSDIESSFESVDADITAVSSRVTTAEGNIRTLQTNLNTAKTDINTVKTNLNSAVSDLESEISATNTKVNNLATVAKTGSYNDLTNKPATMKPSAHTHTLDEIYETSSKKILTSAERTKLNGIAANANNYTLPDTLPLSMMTGTLPINKGGTGATTAAAALSKLGLTATAAEINKLDGVTASTAEINYLKGVTSNIQTQLNNKAAASHNHDNNYINKSLQITADNGQPKYLYREGDDLLQNLLSLPLGVATVYAQNTATGVPKSNEQWRMLIDKTNAEILWVIAFGSVGSVYTNYYNGSYGWQGWKAVYNAKPEALWKGALYPNSGANIVPTKKLSECRSGWILMWSDYDNSTKTANEYDYVTSVVYKCKPDGSQWNGESFNFSIPNYITTEESSDARIMKKLKIYDNKIVGYDENGNGNRNDVVLRAVMEF